MRALTLDAVTNDPIVRTLALKLWRGSQENVLRYGRTVRDWIARRVGFVHEWPEQLHRPDWMLRQLAAGRRVYGDCDDMSMLTAALLLTLGIPCRFAAVKPEGEPDYIHVFAEMLDGNTWYAVDPTSDEIPPGRWDVLRVEVG